MFFKRRKISLLACLSFSQKSHNEADAFELVLGSAGYCEFVAKWDFVQLEAIYRDSSAD